MTQAVLRGLVVTPPLPLASAAKRIGTTNISRPNKNYLILKVGIIIFGFIWQANG